MFRGTQPAKIDPKGRLKIPTEFRRVLDERWGGDLFVTSVVGSSALIYPLPEWEEVEARLLSAPSTDRTMQRYLERVNYYGQQLTLDAQGRMVLPQILRESADLVGEVVVSGRLRHLEIWNRERFDAKLAEEPFTDSDYQALAERGI